MRISQIKKQAKETLRGKWGLTVSLTFIIFLLNAVLPSIVEMALSGGPAQWYNRNDTPASANIFELVYSLALMPFSAAVYWFYLNLVREKGAEIPQIFSVYQDGSTALKLVGVTLLQALYTFLWSLLFLIPGIIKGISYSQTFYLLKDHPEYSITRAITESRIRMKGNKGKYFLLGLSFIGWGILSVLTVGIGFLWLIPYVTTSLATFYNELIASTGHDTKEIDF